MQGIVWADRNKIMQVLLNLVGNAIKFTPGAGETTIITELESSGWAQASERYRPLGQGPEIALGDLPAEIAQGLRENRADALSYRHAVEAARAVVIKQALAHTHGNRAAAARILGLHKTHLLNLIKSLGIEC